MIKLIIKLKFIGFLLATMLNISFFNIYFLFWRLERIVSVFIIALLLIDIIRFDIFYN